MTAIQKKVFAELFSGAFLIKQGAWYRLIDKQRRPVCKISARSMKKVRPFLRIFKEVLVIDLREVRKQRRNHWVKQYYLENYRQKKESMITVARPGNRARLIIEI